MSERKVLSKYYPPDFDPSKIEKRIKKPKNAGPKVQTVRLMAPFPMRCTSCGEYIYKGRKFNARKETTDEKYYAITIFRFYIRCTRCSAEITFKTDPKHMDYTCERGAKRNFEPWREAKLAEETEEERLDRLEREEAERDKMTELEKKTDDAKREMEIADALDDVRTRNAMRERAGVDGAISSVAEAKKVRDEEAERVEREIEEQARRAFMSATGERVRRLESDIEVEEEEGGPMLPPPPVTFERKLKTRKTLPGLVGVKRKEKVEQKDGATTVVPRVQEAPKSALALVSAYDSDSD